MASPTERASIDKSRYSPGAQPITLYTLLGDYPNTRALKRGAIASQSVRFDFANIEVPHSAFKALVREQKFDLSEISVVTFLQAWAYGKPYILLPIVVLGRDQRHTLVYNPDRGEVSPGDLHGRRIGIRSYSQTTVVWLRGILAEEYGMDFRRVRWVCLEGPHLTEYHDPQFVERAPPGKGLSQMLLDGEIDAAVLGGEIRDERLKPLIPDAEAAAEKWTHRHRGIPINHMMTMRASIARERRDIVREVYRLLLESKETSPEGFNTKALQFGIEENRQMLELVAGYATDQGLIPQCPRIEDLFESVAGVLD